ncbi:hypothetical protein CEXT_323301 [Caerostris extrusa]|uniref:Uncharacterized protein n=1 Tax=Caerostris extrusa TaxID=172846 RepID=A0AAV4VK28_CAEEX|nr:hypothetical protein CEXT_323301 [Caerostris extrusa]
MQNSSENDSHVLRSLLGLCPARELLESEHGPGAPYLVASTDLPQDVAIRVGQIGAGSLRQAPRPAGVPVVRVATDDGPHVGLAQGCLYLWGICRFS